MTNIKLSDKGKAFLKKNNAAVQIASAIAVRNNDLQSEGGLSVRIDEHTSVTVRSAAVYSADIAEA